MQKEIKIDGQLNAPLDWNKGREEAKEAAANGLKIRWDLNLGLFENLTFPLDNLTQYKALCLSLEHFRDTIWKDFESISTGLCLCTTQANFSKGYQWNETQMRNWQGWLKDHFDSESTLGNQIGKRVKFDDCDPRDSSLVWLAQLYCRDACADYLQLLIANLIDSIPLFARIDCSCNKDIVDLARLTSAERFDPIRLMPEGRHELISEEATLGICLPSSQKIPNYYFDDLRLAVRALTSRNISFRIIPEEFLINKWDGLNDLIVASISVGPQCKRKLQGFCAAGGRVLTAGSSLGLANEIQFEPMLL